MTIDRKISELYIPDQRSLERIFIRFIDKNDIELECPGDINTAIRMFCELTEYRLRQNFAKED